jgi:hypothetical protein
VTNQPAVGPLRTMTVGQLLCWAIEITNAAGIVAVWTRDKDLF